MSRPIINTEECSECGICADNCPNGVLSLEDGGVIKVASEDNCDGRGTCAEDCPMECIEIEEE